jgi:hypothetical protein
VNDKVLILLEAAIGIEPMNKDFRYLQSCFTNDAKESYGQVGENFILINLQSN